jgi:hypothetical protein
MVKAKRANEIKMSKLKSSGFVTIWKHNIEPVYWDSLQKDLKMDIKSNNAFRVFIRMRF